MSLSPAKVSEHNHPQSSLQKVMHGDKCPPQMHGKCWEEHQGEEYRQVVLASQTQLSPQDMKLSGNLRAPMAAMAPNNIEN